MRAGVAPADQHQRVVPRLGAHLPRLQVAVGRQRPEDRPQLVVDDDVEQCVERAAVLALGQIADDPALQTFVRLGVRVADLVAPPGREAREDAGLGSAGPLVHPSAHGGITQLRDPFRNRKAHHVRPARQHEQRAVVAE